MSRFTIGIASVLVLSLVGQVAQAARPVIEQVHRAKVGDQLLGDEWVNVLQSVKTVEIPAGQAFITWTIRASIGEPASVRPFIGEHTITEDWRTPVVPGDQSTSCSWSTETEGGTVTVGLQARATHMPATIGGGNHTMAWTLIVFPDDPPVPAISTLGLVIMAVVVLGVGAVVLARRGQPSKA